MEEKRRRNPLALKSYQSSERRVTQPGMGALLLAGLGEARIYAVERRSLRPQRRKLQPRADRYVIPYIDNLLSCESATS